ncbi:MAG: hypothetical protein ABFD69_14895 [Candidatus Sumerlaeia bacterium]
MKRFHFFRALAAFALLAMFAALPTRARALDLWPLAEFTDERTMILYPFYVHEGDFIMAFPFYYRTNQGHDTHLLWPMVKLRDGRLTRLVPVWLSSDSGTFTIIPLMHQTPEYTMWTVPPIYTRTDGKFIGVFPFFARSPNMMFVAPDFYMKKTQGETYWTVWPFCFYDRDPSGVNVWAFPFFMSSRSGSDSSLWCFPVYRTESPGQTETLVFPLYYNRHEKTAGGESRDFWLFPWVCGDSPTESYSGLLPVYYASKNTSSSGETEHRFNLLWPLYHRERVERAGAEISYYRRFLVFSDAKERDGTREFGFLGITHETTPGQKTTPPPPAPSTRPQAASPTPAPPAKPDPQANNFWN